MREDHMAIHRFDASGQISDHELLSALLTGTSDSIYFKDLHSQFLAISQAQATRFNLRQNADAVGKSDRDFFAEDHALEALHDEQEIMRTGVAVTGKEEKETWPDKEPSWVLTSKMPLRNAEGEIVGTFGISRDITRTKRAEEALHAAHRESEIFINSVPSILIGMDSQGRIKRWNMAATATFGMSESDVRGKPLATCGITWLHPDIQEEVNSWLHVQNSERIDDVTFERDSRKRSLGLTIKTMECSSSDEVALLIVGADTTERIQSELQLRQAQKMEGIGQLAAGIAHEINSPVQYAADNITFVKESWSAFTQLVCLAQKIGQENAANCPSQETITQLINLLRDSDFEYLQKETPRALDQSLDGIQRIAGIVRAMREFSHPDSDEKQAIDVNRAIEAAITVSRNEWKYVADVETHLDTTLPLVRCFAGEFNQVIINLLINAAHAIGEVVADNTKGKIIVGSRHVGDSVEVSIKDTGTGIPKEVRSRVFEPFFTTKPIGKGTGQGLALAHAVVVRRHGGRIWFDTEAGCGTTFFIQIPLKTA